MARAGGRLRRCCVLDNPSATGWTARRCWEWSNGSLELLKAINSRRFAAVVRAPRCRSLTATPKWETTLERAWPPWTRTCRRPVRDVDKPFAMHRRIFSRFSGRGPSVRDESSAATVPVGEEVAIVGFRATQQKVVTGVDLFPQMLDEGLRETSRVLLRARTTAAWSGGQGVQTRQHYTAHEVQGGETLRRQRRRPPPVFSGYRRSFIQH